MGRAIAAGVGTALTPPIRARPATQPLPAIAGDEREKMMKLERIQRYIADRDDAESAADAGLHDAEYGCTWPTAAEACDDPAVACTLDDGRHVVWRGDRLVIVD